MHPLFSFIGKSDFGLTFIIEIVLQVFLADGEKISYH